MRPRFLPSILRATPSRVRFSFDHDNAYALVLFTFLLFSSLIGNAQSFSFTQTDYPGGTGYPARIAFGDFNTDGKIDLAVRYRYPYVGIFLNHGDGTFAPVVLYPRYGAYDSVEIAATDFNGDGKLDLVLSEQTDDYDGAVSVMLGNGDGTFATAVPVTETLTNAVPAGMKIGDINGDGKPDILMGTTGPNGYGPDSVRVFLNNGTGGLAAGQTISGVAGPSALELTDLNGDGVLDLIIAENGNNTFPGAAILTFLNDGTGVFRFSHPYPVGGVLSLTVADFDNDGKMDIGGAVYDPNGLMIFRNNGDGSLTLSVVVPTPTSPAYIASGDFNMDDKVDLAVVDAREALYLYPGQGDLTFGSPDTFEPGPQPMFVATGQLDNDQRPDLVTCNWYHHDITVFLNQPPAPVVTPYEWIQVSASGAPSVALAASAYDQVSNHLFLFGGQVPPFSMWSGGSHDVWSLTHANGADGLAEWTQLNPLGTPPSDRFSSVAGYNPSSNRLIVHGGRGVTGTYALVNPDGVGGDPTWTTLTEEGGPADNMMSGAYDPASDKFFVFGGGANNCWGLCSATNDTWMLTNASGVNGTPVWTTLTGEGTPPPERFAAIAAYDATSNRLIVTAGVGPSGYLDDTWILTNANQSEPTPSQWIQIVSGGLKRLLASGAYDAVHNRLFVFGGQTGPEMCFGPCPAKNDVWVLTHANGLGGTPAWKLLLTKGVPPSKRYNAAVGYDSINGRLIVSGGLWLVPDTFVLTNLNIPEGGAETTISLSSSVNPSAFQQAIALTATVISSGGTPTGTVDFTADGGISLGTSALDSSGTTTFSVSSLTPGPHNITATYGGDANYASSSASLAQTVKQASTALSLTSSVSPSLFKQAVTFTATITPQFGGEATGSVAFYADGSPLGTAVLSANTASFNTSDLSVGTHTISAVYGGDSNFLSSTRTLSQKVKKATTTTALLSSQNPSSIGQPVTFTATITPAFGGAPTGTVTFKAGTTVLGTVAVTGGSASYTTDSLPLGSASITAAYSGDANFVSSSKSLLQKVNKFATATALNSSLNPSVFGQAVTFTATVSSTGPTPSGTVEFRAGTNVLGSGALAGGTATFTTSVLNAGTYSMKAIYSGDASSAASTSPVVSQKVTKAATAVSLVSSQNPTQIGQTVTFTATVSSSAGTPAGTVTFKAGSKALGTVALSNGTAAVAASFSVAKPQTITATYSGAANYFGSSAAITQVVQ